MSITARDTRSVAISELDILRCFMSRMPGRSTSTSAGSSWWLLLLLIPFVALLWVPFYNRLDPAVFGIPFFYWYQFVFYWYQFVWVILTSLIILLVDSRTREVDAADRDDQP
jgi:energy-coupling factor transporter transmembrane protein EcfT